MSKKSCVLILVILALVLGLAGQAWAKPTVKPTMNYHADFVALNGSMVSGHAQLQVKGTTLKVHMEIMGLTARQLHEQSIMGMMDGSMAVVPPLTADRNHDGFITFPEIKPYCGKVLLPLTPYPVGTRHGSLVFDRTYALSAQGSLDLATVPLERRVIVLQGKKVCPPYMIPFYWPELPVACAQIYPIN
jgi:hypothetical protein